MWYYNTAVGGVTHMLPHVLLLSSALYGVTAAASPTLWRSATAAARPELARKLMRIRPELTP